MIKPNIDRFKMLFFVVKNLWSKFNQNKLNIEWNESKKVYVRYHQKFNYKIKSKRVKNEDVQ